MVETGRTKKQDLDVWDSDKESWDLRAIANQIEQEESFKFISDDDTDQLFVYEDGIWKEKGESVIRRKCLELTNNLLKNRNETQVKRIIKTRNEIYMDEQGFETKDYLVPFTNGVYDVREQEFRDFRKDDNFTFKHEVYYVEDKEVYEKMMGIDIEDYEGKAEKFLWTLQDTERKVKILKEAAGLSLLSNYPVDEAPILFGQGSNGKNMYVELIKQMVGAWHSINLDEMTEDKFAKKELENCTFVFFDELGNVKDPNKVKQFIGNEEMRVRPMRDTGYMAKQRAFPVLAANEIPKAPEQTDGFFRRFQIVDFPYQFTSKENDGNKDKQAREDIEKEYMNEHTLNLFATEVVKMLPDVIEKEGFTESQATEVTRQNWNTKSAPVYSFLDQYVEQGDLPEHGSKAIADKIRKDKLLEMANEYIKAAKGTKIRQHELTRSIENNPDLEIGKDGRISTADGKDRRAYTGIKLTLPEYHETQGKSDLLESRDLISLKYWQQFSDADSYQAAQGLVIAESDAVAKTIKYLEYVNKDRVSLLDLVAEFKFSQKQLEEVTNSELLSTFDKNDLDYSLPQIEIDQEAFKQAVKEHGGLSMDSGDLKPVSRWVSEKIRDLTNNQQVLIDDYFIEPGVQKGYSEDKIEDTVNKNLERGNLYEPDPGKVGLMG